MQYDGYSDEELIERLRLGEEDITDYILEKYKPLVRKRTNAMFLIGGENEDLIQEGMIGLFKALRDYDAGRDASFLTFAELCISRQMYTAVQASRRKKHIPLNTYVSLYSDAAERGEGDGEHMELVNAIVAQSGQNPEDTVIDRENLQVLEQIIDQELSSFEKQVLDLYLTGMSYVQIARVLGKDGKSADNALQRIKSKLRRATGR